jgi:uroporphyrinogen-III synthase
MKKVLYLGLNPQFFLREEEIIHYPVIKLIPRDIKGPFTGLTYCLFTSKNSVRLFKEHANLKDFKCISIGSSTSYFLKEEGIEPFIECSINTQEGLIEELQKLPKESSFLYPRSSSARPLLASFLEKEGYLHQVVDLYDTVSEVPGEAPDLLEISEIFFTSPSTVEGFFKIYSSIPKGVKVSFQGPITEEAFDLLQSRY